MVFKFIIPSILDCSVLVGIEMQFEYRCQTLFWLCISIDIEILFHVVKSIILHLLILQLSKIVLLTYIQN